MSSNPTAIIAFTGEDRRYERVTAYAANIAAECGATLLLYDIDAAGLQAPLPTIWSAEGTRERFQSGRLTADQLETLGRADLARQVRLHEARGLETFGWLPEHPNVDGLAKYAEEQGADMIVVPSHSDHRSIVDKIRGLDTGALGDRTAITVAVVDEEEGVAVS
jgi:nucleotide-binding universal stress UspA family protein